MDGRAWSCGIIDGSLVFANTENEHDFAGSQFDPSLRRIDGRRSIPLRGSGRSERWRS
jgi:hypothetical protein